MFSEPRSRSGTYGTPSVSPRMKPTPPNTPNRPTTPARPNSPAQSETSMLPTKDWDSLPELSGQLSKSVSKTAKRSVMGRFGSVFE